MKINIGKWLLTVGCLSAVAALNAAEKRWHQALQAESAALDESRIEVVEHKDFTGGKGVALKKSVPARSKLDDDNSASDVSLVFTIPNRGLYYLKTISAVDEEGIAAAAKARSKYQSFFAGIRVAGSRAVRRVIYVPWRSPHKYTSWLGIFELEAGRQTVKIDLPRGVRLDQVTVQRYLPPSIPAAAKSYRLPFQVPSHPRLLINPAVLSRIRRQMNHPDNIRPWQELKKYAVKPYLRKFNKNVEIGYEKAYLQIVRDKAFYYLVTGDKKVGQEAVRLMKEYIGIVEFGNILDVTRETGETIYSASLVYDWCYDLIDKDDKTIFRKNMMRLARTMECGWPPFLQDITTGHGNEAQINRDLLSMAVAIYDEDPEPLKYCSYQVFEKLLPIRKFEYRSPRHSQGLSYASVRFRWEMYAAMIYKRLLGQDIFSDGMKKMGHYWIYMQTPCGMFFRDGDGSQWIYSPLSPMVMLLCSSYSQDPFLNGIFYDMGRKRVNALDFLLFHDVQLKAESKNIQLPRGFFFGPVYPGLSVRTSWQVGKKSDAAAAMVRGGGYHSGNHQHSDAGDFQIFYRGQIITPLSLYKFYGTPYDFNFAKRSVSRSSLLVYDPAEKFSAGNLHNDGGARFVGGSPATLEALTGKAVHKYGSLLSHSFIPDAQKPVFSIYSANLKGAYSDKVKDLVRTFAFIDLGKADQPAAAVVYDQLVKKQPDFDTFWQVTTLCPPEKSGDDLILSSFRKDKELRGKMLLQMVKPIPEKRKLEILTGKDAHKVFGKSYQPPVDLPEAHGSRVMFKSMEKSSRGEFFCTMSLYTQDMEPEPVKVTENSDCFIVQAADRTLVLVKGLTPRRKTLNLTLEEGLNQQFAVHNLQPGKWQIRTAGKVVKSVTVKAGELTASWNGNGGKVELLPVK